MPIEKPYLKPRTRTNHGGFIPIYQYQNLNTGKLEEHFRTVERRDCVEPHLKRITVPQRIGYIGGLTEEGTPEHQAPKAFRDIELSGTSHHEIARHTGFSREEIRRVWDF